MVARPAQRLFPIVVVVPLLLAGPLPAQADPGSDPPDPGSGGVQQAPQARVADTPTPQQIRRFHLTKRDLARIAKAQAWASTSRGRAARQCRSGDNFQLVTPHRYGAYQLTRGLWRDLGGRRFGRTAADAPKFAQKLVAWKSYKRSGWTRVGCPTADWMGIVFHRASRTPLGRMLIPGSHDSGASGIRVTPPCTTALIAGAPPVYEQASKLNPCVVAAMAKAQDQNLGAQLRGGVRYLDMRVGVPKKKVITHPVRRPKHPLKVPLVLHHEFVSQPLVKGLGQVLTFVKRHPTEQVILDFQHIDLTGDPAIDHYYYVALDQILHRYRPDRSTRTVCAAAWSHSAIGGADRKLATRVPIRKAWRAGRNLLVLMPPDMPADNCFRSRDAAILSLWPNTESPSVSKSDNDKWLAERRQRIASSDCVDGKKQNWCGLFVNQLQLSLQFQTQLDCVLHSGPSCSLLAYSKLVNDKVAGYMTNWTSAGQPTNIEIIDFYERSRPSVADRLILLNWQRTGQLH